MTQAFRQFTAVGFMSLLVCVLLLSPAALAASVDPALDMELTPQPTFEVSEQAQKQPPRQPTVLKASVKTLDAAIREEAHVDWYSWYMAARNYLSVTGGLQCKLNTPIKFHRNGRIEASTRDAYCLQSVAFKQFGLPKNTALDAVILPVRSGSAPPASKEELYQLIRQNGNRKAIGR